MSTAPELTAIERYYRLHSRIYDTTRWSFLFGRMAIIEDLAAVATPERILEVGCGTGKNLVNLAERFPQATITGVDLSETMLTLAREKVARCGDRVQLVHRAYDAPFADGPGFDLVLFSYALSMFNPSFDTAIAAAWLDLAPGGHIAVVDFHDTPLPAFARWMGVNHVRMEAHLQPRLCAQFTPVSNRLHSAYGGVWRYLRFVGSKGITDVRTA
jgi:S-adenosylmethionine-diacylgycerolhomoserine-N-methlytransferase